MKLPGVNIKLVAASLAVALVLLFGGHAVFRMTSISIPVERRLRLMAEVKSHSIELTPYGTVLDVELADVTDLSETFRKMELAAARLAGRNGVWIRIRDSRDETLRDAYYRLHFSLQEAAAQGSFAQLESRAEQVAREAGLSDFRIVVDSDYIYVAMSNGASQLYQVVSRQSHETSASGESAIARSSRSWGGVRIW